MGSEPTAKSEIIMPENKTSNEKLDATIYEFVSLKIEENYLD